MVLTITTFGPNHAKFTGHHHGSRMAERFHVRRDLCQAVISISGATEMVAGAARTAGTIRIPREQEGAAHVRFCNGSSFLSDSVCCSSCVRSLSVHARSPQFEHGPASSAGLWKQSATGQGRGPSHRPL